MSKSISVVYKNIYIYRIIMNLLYGMKYKKRFENIIELIDKDNKNILELCFGDTYIAKYARDNNKQWIGMDINEQFVSYAIKEGYNALNRDILSDKDLPKADICIISGSLYHFKNNMEFLLKKMFHNTTKIIISEPINNLSNNKYFGFFAKKSANAGKGDEEFRYTEDSFLNMLDQYKEKLSFSYDIIRKDRDILVVLKKK